MCFTHPSVRFASPCVRFTSLSCPCVNETETDGRNSAPSKSTRRGPVQRDKFGGGGQSFVVFAVGGVSTFCPRTFALPLSFCSSLSFWPPSAFSHLKLCPLLSFRLLRFPSPLPDLRIVLSIPFLALTDCKSYVHRPSQLANRGPLALADKLTESLRDNEDLGLGAPDLGGGVLFIFLFLFF